MKEEYVNTGRVSHELRNLILDRTTWHWRDWSDGADEAYHPLSDQVFKNQQAVLQGVFSQQGAFQQALAGPENQRFVDAAQVAGFYDFFAQRGLSEDQARACLSDFGAVSQIAENANTQSDELGVTGTPTFFINGRKLDGVVSWADLEPRLQEAGAR